MAAVSRKSKALDNDDLTVSMTGDFLGGKIAEVNSTGKKALSKGVEKEWAPPRKHASALYGSLSAVVKSLDRTTRRQLAEIENLPVEARQGRRIEIDAATFLDLFHTHVAATVLRDTRISRAAQAKAAASQQRLDIEGQGRVAAPQCAASTAINAEVSASQLQWVARYEADAHSVL